MKSGEFVKYHRLACGYKSQRTFAKKTGISSATISRIESNIQVPEARTIQQLAQYLPSTTYSELMEAFGYEALEPVVDANEGQYKVDYLVFRKIERYIECREQIRVLKRQTDNYKKLLEQPVEPTFKITLKETLDDHLFSLKVYEQKIKLIEKELIEVGVQFTPPDDYLEPMPF